VALAFDREQIRKIVHEIGERLEGDWLLIGGALVALWLESERTTEDLDAVSIRGGRGGSALDTARVLAALDGLADTDDEQLRARRARLRSRLSP